MSTKAGLSAINITGSNGVRSPRPIVSNGRAQSSCEERLASVNCNSQSVLEANRARSRCGELTVSLSIALVTHCVTLWILYNIAVPLIWRQYAFRYKHLLFVLAFFAIYMSVYVFQIGWGAFRWTRRYRAEKDVDWYKEWCLKVEQADGGDVLDWKKVHHFVIVTNYKEPIEMLKLLAYSLMSQRCDNFCKHQITLVLAMEEREGADVKYKADTLINELGAFFHEVIATFHPPDVPGDIKGKASNYKWAVQEVEACIREKARQRTMREDHCIIHVADADSLYDPNYFPNVTYHFCINPKRYHFVWQPCMLPTCNLWDLAAPCRQVNMMIAAQEMMSAHDKTEFQIPFSTYGYALKTLQKVAGTGNAADAQDGDVICEDHHLFIKAFFATDAQLSVHPIFLPCLNFAVGGEAQSWCANIHDRFVQAKRHMFGISEFIFCVVLVFRGKWFCRKGFGCRAWFRTFGLVCKFAKIHLIPYLGFWVTLGLILALALKIHRVYCEQFFNNDEYPRAPPLGCQDGLSATAETIEASLFSAITTLTLFGTLFIIVAFVRMLRHTHHTLMNIADPNGAFMDSAVWERYNTTIGSASQRSQSPAEHIRSFPLLQEHSDMSDHLELTQDDPIPTQPLQPELLTQGTAPTRRSVSHRPRRPMQIGGGVPWLGGMLQLGIEFIVFGFITNIALCTVPAFIAMYKLIFQGHRMEYVTAPKPGMGGQEIESQTESPGSDGNRREATTRIPTRTSKRGHTNADNLFDITLRRNHIG